MKSVVFAKPKALNLDCIKFLVEQKEQILGVVLYEKNRYEDNEFCRFCEMSRIPVLDFSETDQLFELYKNQVEMIYCSTFPKRLKDSWIKSAQIAAINFHSAPLPEYRGVFGYNFAFLNHETSFGVSCHFLVDGFDEGDIIEVQRFPYDFEHGCIKELVEITEQQTLSLFKKTYQRFKNGEKVSGIPQGEGRYYGRSDFEKAKKIQTGDDVLQKIRAFWYPPFEGAYCDIGGHRVMLVLENDYRELLPGKAVL